MSGKTGRRYSPRVAARGMSPSGRARPSGVVIAAVAGGTRTLFAMAEPTVMSCSPGSRTARKFSMSHTSGKNAEGVREKSDQSSAAPLTLLQSVATPDAVVDERSAFIPAQHDARVARQRAIGLGRERPVAKRGCVGAAGGRR